MSEIEEYEVYVAPGWELVSGGCTARIERRYGSNQVVKVQYPNCPDPEMSRRELKREFDIYQALPRHPRLLHLLPGSTPERLILPYLDKGTLKARLDPEAPPLTVKQRLQLAADAAEAVEVLHANAVVHNDIQPHNFMLISEHRLCMIDFAGSMLDGQEGTAMESPQYFLPRPIEEPSTARTDLFALGSVLYAIFSGRVPYEDKTDEEVTQLFTAADFPSTDKLLCGDVILRCWTGIYESAHEVHETISKVLEGFVGT